MSVSVSCVLDDIMQGSSNETQNADQGIEQDGKSHRPRYALGRLKGAMIEVEEVG